MPARFPKNIDEAVGAAKGVAEARVVVGVWARSYRVNAEALDRALYDLEHRFWNAKAPAKKAKRR